MISGTFADSARSNKVITSYQYGSRHILFTNSADHSISSINLLNDWAPGDIMSIIVNLLNDRAHGINHSTIHPNLTSLLETISRLFRSIELVAPTKGQ